MESWEIIRLGKIGRRKVHSREDGGWQSDWEVLFSGTFLFQTKQLTVDNITLGD